MWLTSCFQQSQWYMKFIVFQWNIDNQYILLACRILQFWISRLVGTAQRQSEHALGGFKTPTLQNSQKMSLIYWQEHFKYVFRKWLNTRTLFLHKRNEHIMQLSLSNTKTPLQQEVIGFRDHEDLFLQYCNCNSICPPYFEI